MLFVTNRRLVEGRRSSAGRSVSFDLADSEPGASLYFCQRRGPGLYEELLAAPFLGRLRRSPRQQILLLVHGFNCQPEKGVFPRAVELQNACDELAPGLVEVVPLVWPCDDDFGVALYGTTGGAKIDIKMYANDGTLTFFTDIGGSPAIAKPRVFKGEGHAAVVRDFVNVIRSGDYTAHRGHAALKRTQVIEACYESAKLGREVVLE